MKLNSTGLAAAVLAMTSVAAPAQDVPIPRDTVSERLQAALRAGGVRAGGFRVFPSLAVGLTGDDNIFADADDEESDTIIVVHPVLEVRSDWSRHSLQFGAEARLGRYDDNSDEDYDDAEAYARTRLQMAAESAFTLGARYSALHEDRSSPDDRGGLSPTEFDRTLLTAGFERGGGRFGLALDLSFAKFDYDDTRSLTGVINHDDRDRDDFDAEARTGYSPAEGVTVFVQGGHREIDYDATLDDAGFVRSADDLRLALGLELAIAGRTDLEAFFGQQERSLDDSRFEDIDTSWFGARIVHRVSGLTTLNAEASRDIRATSLASASGYVTTRVDAGIDHELMRNLVLKLRVGRQDNDYEGIDRDEEVFDAEFQALYIVNRHLDLRLQARFRERDVDQQISDNDDFDAGTIAVTVNGRL